MKDQDKDTLWIRITESRPWYGIGGTRGVLLPGEKYEAAIVVNNDPHTFGPYGKIRLDTEMGKQYLYITKSHYEILSPLKELAEVAE